MSRKCCSLITMFFFFLAFPRPFSQCFRLSLLLNLTYCIRIVSHYFPRTTPLPQTWPNTAKPIGAPFLPRNMPFSRLQHVFNETLLGGEEWEADRPESRTWLCLAVWRSWARVNRKSNMYKTLYPVSPCVSPSLLGITFLDLSLKHLMGISYAFTLLHNAQLEVPEQLLLACHYPWPPLSSQHHHLILYSSVLYNS